MRLPLPRSAACTAVLLAGMAVAAAARAGGEPDPSVVDYVAEKLVVTGVVYLPDSSAGAHRPGIVLVGVKPERHADFAAMVERFGLAFGPRAVAPSGEVALQVPVGYETHWVAALRAQPSVRTARLKSVDIGP